MKEGSMGTQQQQEEANRACVLEMLKIECEEELKVKEEKLKKRAERKHKMAMNRMEKQIHHQIINVKRERRMVRIILALMSTFRNFFIIYQFLQTRMFTVLVRFFHCCKLVIH